MPYVVNRANNDSRAVGFEFDPPISMDFYRDMLFRRPTPDERRLLPTRVRVVRPPARGRCHQSSGIVGGLFIVSEALKTLLQGLETVHDFSRLEIIREARGNPFPDIYWLLLSVPEVDAVIANFTDFDGPYLKARARCTLSADAIRGRHFWRGISRLSTTYFCSDEFRNGVRDLRLDGFDIRHKCEVR